MKKNFSFDKMVQHNLIGTLHSLNSILTAAMNVFRRAFACCDRYILYFVSVIGPPSEQLLDNESERQVYNENCRLLKSVSR